jgi:hypothetical protein
MFNIESNIDILTQYKELNYEELQEKFLKITKSILNKKFGNDLSRQKINYNKDKGDININCPICGDSKFNPNKQRGHIFLKTLTYKCWNGGCDLSFSSLHRFFNYFNELENLNEVELNFLKKSYENLDLGNVERGNNYRNFNSIIGLSKHGIPKLEIINRLKLKTYHNSKDLVNLLKQRKQDEFFWDVFAYHEFTESLYMFNTSPDGEKVISFQKRLNSSSVNMRFQTYNYEKIWKDIFNITNLDEKLKESLNKIGLYYNIYKIDYFSDIFVHESIIDSHHLKNSLALMGTSNHINLENGYYMYDNSLSDQAGFKTASENIKKGNKTFLWKRFLKDYPQYSSCKDLNDIFKLGCSLKEPDFKEYFSNNKIDIFYI